MGITADSIICRSACLQTSRKNNKRPLPESITTSTTPNKRRQHCRRLPISKHRQKHRHRRVRFATELVRTKEIPSRHTFTAEEKKCAWWTRQEGREFRMREKERREIETTMKKELQKSIAAAATATTTTTATEKKVVDEVLITADTTRTELSTDQNHMIILPQQMKCSGHTTATTTTTTTTTPSRRRRIIIKTTSPSGQRILIKTRRPLTVIVQ